MTFYFTTVGDIEYLLEFDEGNESKVIEALQSELTMEGQTDFLPGDEPDIEATIHRLIKEGVIKSNPHVKVAKVTRNRAFTRDAKGAFAQWEFCEY